mgnify:FL=1
MGLVRDGLGAGGGCRGETDPFRPVPATGTICVEDTVSGNYYCGYVSSGCLLHFSDAFVNALTLTLILARPELREWRCGS